MLIKLISFLENRFQRVVLNGQTSLWEQVLANIPQGSILEPLFFLIYINNLSINLSPMYLVIHLHEKLDFNAHIIEKISKTDRGIGIIKKLQRVNYLEMHS